MGGEREIAGYYEWQDTPGGKQPWYFTARDGSPALTMLLSSGSRGAKRSHYSPNGGIIAVDAAMTTDEVVVAVADHGIGIPASDLDRLFERYHRGSNVSGIVGTGVGLNLVKMVVDLHGGEILVESTEGKGSRFTVRLPVAPAPPIDIAATAPKSVPEPEQAEEQGGEPAEQQADPARPAAADPLGA